MGNGPAVRRTRAGFLQGNLGPFRLHVKHFVRFPAAHGTGDVDIFVKLCSAAAYAFQSDILDAQSVSSHGTGNLVHTSASNRRK